MRGIIKLNVFLLFLTFCCVAISYAQEKAGKKVLSHDDFDAWEKVTNHSVSNNGEWISYSINPQEGDGKLWFFNTINGKKIEIERGYQPSFLADSRWAVALIKPWYKETRQAKIDKKKDFDLPSDSLAIIDLKKGTILKESKIISYKTGKEGGNWIAWLSSDTAYISQEVLKDKKAGKPLVIFDVNSGTSNRINGVDFYKFSDNGNKIALRFSKGDKDSLATSGIGVVMLPDTSCRIIDRDKLFYGEPVFDHAGDKIAYIASNDSADSGTKICELYFSEIKDHLNDPKEIKVLAQQGSSNPHFAKPHASDEKTQAELEKQWVAKNNASLNNKLKVNQYSKPVFSYDGRRLVIGVAPPIAPDDTTLVDFETPSLDIWRWDASFTPPQEISMAEELKKHTFPVVINIENNNEVLVTDNPLANVIAPNRWDADWALIDDPSENIISVQWDYQFPVELSVKNIITSEERKVGTVRNELYELSPSGKFVMWFKDRQYHSYDIATGNTSVISLGVPYPLWQEDQNVPLHEKEPYGTMGWNEDETEVLVYDRYDVWSLDPKGEREPFCLTGESGRKQGVRFRYIKTDPDFRFFKKGTQLLYSVFDYSTKKNGLATAVYSSGINIPKIDILDGYTFNRVRKAKDADVYSWVQGNFETPPVVFASRNLEKKKFEMVAESNPFKKDYKWGTASLYKWYAYDGSPAEGVLYLPEDFNENEEYPMIAYFYETYTEDLYYHYDMEPSWSWINFPFYVSRGYVIFVPDIKYTSGVPGESAWNYVCSGVEDICKKYPNIDKNRVGIDGQSWGGYQTAYLVTRTNMFACAGSGAPVANMTSAFGGIRWGTGDSRQAQYEVGQSRIGRNLWEAPQLYIANSPVFYADRVETPLLIMHNDDDGAVPWYQGIELFMALRRLGKPVWMLQYNGEAHNLKERRNRKDITKRLQQFFDHYLKGDPMPEWMIKGIPIVRKGQEFGY